MQCSVEVLAGNAKSFAIQCGDLHYSTLILKLKELYHESPIVSDSLAQELRRQVHTAAPSPKELLTDFVTRLRQLWRRASKLPRACGLYEEMVVASFVDSLANYDPELFVELVKSGAKRLSFL